MNNPTGEFADAPMTREEMHAALFAQMVMQLASTALVLMGRAPNPVTGQTETDLEAAQLFVEQLEMLATKTRGNLSPEEEQLLKQHLMSVRLAFVETVQQPPTEPTANTPAPHDHTASSAAPGADSRKKFSKRYGAG